MAEQIDLHEQARQAHDSLLSLGAFTVAFAAVERAPRYPDGHRETDVEHSYHLGLSATELAASFHPELNAGLVAQFSLVHDMPERYTGDVWTFEISDADRAAKEAAEKIATERLLQELPPHTAQLLRRYEEQVEPEARFVRFVDKVVPAVIGISAHQASTFKEDHNVHSAEHLAASRHARIMRLREMFPEFKLLHIVREMVSDSHRQAEFPDA